MSNKAKELNIDDLKRRLKAERKKRDYKQEYVVAKSGLSIGTVRDAENPNVKKIPDLDTVIKLCNFYHCSLDYMCGKSDYTDHHKEYIGKTLGIEQKTIENISALPDHIKSMLECLINETGLLYTIYEYLTANVSEDGLPIYKSTYKSKKGFEVEKLDFVQFPDNTSKRTIYEYNDLLKTAILYRIRDILNRVKPNPSQD